MEKDAVKKYDVVGIGRAFMDVVGHVSDDFLKEHGLDKGCGNYLDVEHLREIRSSLPDARLFPGGAAGNTINGIASLGGKAAFFGKACSDNMGEHFCAAYDLAGVDYLTESTIPFAPENIATGRCIVLVTPDKDRTFAMTLGVCENLMPEDIKPKAIEDSKVLYIEGQMLVSDSSNAAVIKAVQIAKKAEVKVFFNLHDLNFQKESVQKAVAIIRKASDIIIGNEREIRNCFGLGKTEDPKEKLTHREQILIMTKGSKGAQIFCDNEIYTIPSVNKSEIVDSTGAGDMFAAGFIYGYSRKFPIEASGKIGAVAAAEVLGHWGGRPRTDLSESIRSILKTHTL